MTDDIFWQMFRDTGDPMSYLMFKASKSEKEKALNDTNATAGEDSPKAVG